MHHEKTAIGTLELRGVSTAHVISSYRLIPSSAMMQPYGRHSPLNTCWAFALSIDNNNEVQVPTPIKFTTSCRVRSTNQLISDIRGSRLDMHAELGTCSEFAATSYSSVEPQIFDFFCYMAINISGLRGWQMLDTMMPCS